MTESSIQINKRLENLQKHLAEEHPDNPVMSNAVQSFRKLDEVAYSLGLLDKDQSYATRVSWWPMIAVLGTFSAGKSTFINSYLGESLQRTGTQAVDDKFTVLSFSHQAEAKTLPGVALDADPRFPFFQISRSIAEISEAGQQRIDAYLQLKTCPSENLRGKIMIDSPGFDADQQRTATLRLTQHIIDLADLVMVFFDARHPEPGAMQDTLDHLVSATLDRADFNKFLYILNQIDVTAKEDNPEEVVAAWQRSLAHAGLTAGRFYRIYNPAVAIPIENPQTRERYEKKREEDMADIEVRMQQVEVERSYRIVGNLEQTAKDIENRIVPKISDMLKRWRKRVFVTEGIILGSVAVILAIVFSASSTWDLLGSFFSTLTEGSGLSYFLIILLVGGLGYFHFSMRKVAANSILNSLAVEMAGDDDALEQYSRAFRKSTSPFRPIFLNNPAGWGGYARQILDKVRSDSNDYVQALNDRFTNPSGRVKEASEELESK